MRERRKSWADRWCGPLISVVLHGMLIWVLVEVVAFQTVERGRDIAIEVVECSVAPKLDSLPPAADDLPPSELPAVESSSDLLPEFAPDECVEWVADAAVDTAVDCSLVMEGLFAGRSAPARAERLRRFGGEYGEQVDAAVLRALQWLASQQSAIGCWGAVSPNNQSWHACGWSASLKREQRVTRLTSLCLLAFLAHGETPQSDEFGSTVLRAIEYLKRQQEPQSGRLVPWADSHPLKGGEDLGVYAHAQATYALAEAYALTRAPALRQCVARAVQVILDGQLASGAWGNWYVQNISDSSATSWQIQALLAADAAGVEVDGLAEALRCAIAGAQYLYRGSGRWSYRKGPALKTASPGGTAMSGAMVFCLKLLGCSNDSKVAAGLRHLNEVGPSDWDGAWSNSINRSLPATYEWYYATQAIFQGGGARWERWNARFAPMLLAHQSAEGWWRGPQQSAGEETI